MHVEADAVHEVVALRDLAGGLAGAEPELAGDIVFCARAIMATESTFSGHILDSWADGRSSLFTPEVASGADLG